MQGPESAPASRGHSRLRVHLPPYLRAGVLRAGGLGSGGRLASWTLSTGSKNLFGHLVCAYRFLFLLPCEARGPCFRKGSEAAKRMPGPCHPWEEAKATQDFPRGDLHVDPECPGAVSSLTAGLTLPCKRGCAAPRSPPCPGSQACRWRGSGGGKADLDLSKICMLFSLQQIHHPTCILLKIIRLK